MVTYVCPECEEEIKEYWFFLKSMRVCPHCGKQIGVSLKEKE